MRRLVLASSSRHRRVQLARLGVPFVWRAPEVDESPLPHESPEQLVRRLSEAKARALAGAFPDHLIIGGDQVASNAGRIVGKPGSRESALLQLSEAAGRSVRFLTGCAVLDAASGGCEVAVVSCEVTFRPLTPGEIETYIDADEPFDCAGSFKFEGLGIALFERIDGPDPGALTGLPLIALTGMLRRAGLNPLDALHRKPALSG